MIYRNYQCFLKIVNMFIYLGVHVLLWKLPQPSSFLCKFHSKPSPIAFLKNHFNSETNEGTKM